MEYELLVACEGVCAAAGVSPTYLERERDTDEGEAGILNMRSRGLCTSSSEETSVSLLSSIAPWCSY